VRDEGAWLEPSWDTDRGRGLDIIRAIVEELSIGREEGATVLRMRTATKGSAPA
jgi:hypothetical protein